MENDKQTNPIKKLFFGDKEEIEQKAKGYYTDKWYKQERCILIAFIFISFGLGFALLYGDIQSLLLASSLLLPIVFLIYKGYRIGYVLFILYWTFEKFLQIADNEGSSGGAVIWWLVIVSISITAIRVENAKIRLKIAKPHKPIRDTLIAIVLFIGCFVSSIFSGINKNANLTGVYAGYIYRNVYGYDLYCSKNGYELKKYPNLFKERYAEGINIVNEEVERYFSEEDYQEMLKRHDEGMLLSVANEFEELKENDTYKYFLINLMNVNNMQEETEALKCEAFDRVGFDVRLEYNDEIMHSIIEKMR